MDCDEGNFECKGGQPSAVMDYVVKFNLSTEEDYPYIAKKSGKCYRDSVFVPPEEEGRRL